jgi:hypothetical protein
MLEYALSPYPTNLNCLYLAIVGAYPYQLRLGNNSLFALTTKSDHGQESGPVRLGNLLDDIQT